MSHFIKYAEPIVLKKIQDKVKEHIKHLRNNYETYKKVLPLLEKWDGKLIGKRLVTYMEKNLTGVNRIRLDTTCTNLFYLKIDIGDQEISLFLGYNSPYDHKKFVKDYSTPLESCGPAADKLEANYHKLPGFVKRYNKLLEGLKDLDKDATDASFEFDFDVINNNR